MVKRNFEETTSTQEVTQPNAGDMLWDLALDSQDKAIRASNKTKSLKHFRKAREYAISCYDKYIELAESTSAALESSKYFEYASLAK